MKLLFDLINERARTSYTSNPDLSDTENWKIWVAYWLGTAENIRIEMDKAGLSKTAEAIQEIIAETKRYC